MANGQSIFDLIKPQEKQGGIAGALTGSIRGLSDFFAEATPQLLSSQDSRVGFGETFASGLLGGLAAPQRQEEAQRSQQRQEGLAFALQNFDRFTPEIQQQLASSIAPGLTLKPPPTAPSPEREAIINALRDTAKNEKEPPETREQALENLILLGHGEAIDTEIFKQGQNPSEQGRLSFASTMAREYTPDSVDAYLETIEPGESILSGDFDLLKIREDTGRTGGGGEGAAIPSRIRDAQALKDAGAIEAEKLKAREAGEEITDSTAMKNLGISGTRAANVSRFMGITAQDPGAITFSQLYRSSLAQIVRDDFNIEMSAFGDLSAEQADQATKKALLLTSSQVESMRRAGVPIIAPPETLPRSPGALGRVELPQGGEPLPLSRRERIASEVRRRQEAGDSRSVRDIAREVAREITE